MRTPGLHPFIGLVAAAGLSGCKPALPPSQGGALTAAPAAPSVRLSDAEQRYGASATRAAGVTYQPDVIIMEHGAEAIRSQTADGFTWRIDAAAPGAADIEVDKILFATGRVVGRVLKVERNGDDLNVMLGPAELTDIFEEVHISTQGSLDPEKMLVYIAPDGYPGATQDREEPEQAAPVARAAPTRGRAVQVYTVSRMGVLVPLHAASSIVGNAPPCEGSGHGQLRAVQTLYQNDGCDGLMKVGATAADIASVVLGGFSITPSMAGGLQAATHYNKNGLIFNAHIKIRLENPRFTFRLDILHGLKTAAIELAGVGGIETGIEAGTSDSLKNINREFAVPIDISYPIGGPVPFAATFHQSLVVQTLFTAKQGTLRTKGDFSVGGIITAGIINGSPSATAPVFIRSNASLAHELGGESLGVNGLILSYGGKLIIGLGAWGLIVGPYASINTSLGITRGSDLATGLVAYTCRSSTLDFFLDYGLGFAIPAWSAAAVNAFLGLFHAKPVSTSYGTKIGTIEIKKLEESLPPSCGKPG